MPATNRKAAGTSLVDSLDARIRTRPVDNFASIKTYYRSAILDLRQVGTAPCGTGGLRLSRGVGAGGSAARCLLACWPAPTHPPLLPTQADTYRRMHNDDELYILLSRFARFAAFACSAQRQTVSRTAGQAEMVCRHERVTQTQACNPNSVSRHERPANGPASHLPPLPLPRPLPAACSTVIETIPRHRSFAKKDPEYQQLEKVGRRPSWRGNAAALIR